MLTHSASRYVVISLQLTAGLILLGMSYLNQSTTTSGATQVSIETETNCKPERLTSHKVPTIASYI